MIVDAQGNFCGTGGCTFMTATMRLQIRPKKPNPRHSSAYSQAKDLKWKDFDVVISVPKGLQEIETPRDVNSLQLSAKSRRNRGRSAASLYQFIRIIANKVLHLHADSNVEHFGGIKEYWKLKREIMERVAGVFYPRIEEYANSLSMKERNDTCDLVRCSRHFGYRDIEESQLESYLTFPPNSKEAKERDRKKAEMEVKYSELQEADELAADELAADEPAADELAADELESASDAEVSDAEVAHAEKAKKPKKGKTKATDDDPSGVKEEEKLMKQNKPKKLRKKKKIKNDDISDVVTEKFATSEDLLES